MMNELAFINGTQYNWSSIEMCVLDQVITGITSVNYNDSVRKGTQYEIEGFPVYAKEEPKALVTVDHAKINTILQVLSEEGELQNIPAFDIVVSYMNDDDIVTQTVRNCEFISNSFAIDPNNKQDEVVMNLTCSHIEWN